LAPDGQLDGVFTVTLNVGSGNRTVTRLQLTNSAAGVWNTQVGDSFYVVGAANDLNSGLYNAPDGSLNFGVTEGSSFKIFASDFQNQMFLSGTAFTLTVNFADGSTATGNVSVP
jgi:hypothetical protein